MAQYRSILIRRVELLYLQIAIPIKRQIRFSCELQLVMPLNDVIIAIQIRTQLERSFVCQVTKLIADQHEDLNFHSFIRFNTKDPKRPKQDVVKIEKD